MANNPLYPGYSPKKQGEESVNPLYPGYYPGKPVNKRPSSRNIIKPIEYNFDFLMEQIDEIGNEVANTPLGPKWVKDRIIDDWKQQLKVSVSPSNVDIDVTDLDDYATDDLAGATTKLSLDRKDWGIGEKDGWQQTKKQVSKTLKSWLQETTGIKWDNVLESNFSEIQNKANQELWLAALGYGEEKLTPLQKSGVKAISDRTTAYFGNFDSDSKGKGSALNLKGVAAVEVERNGHTIVHDDLYAQTAKNAATFERSKDSFKGRDSGHNAFLSEAFHAMDVEIQDKVRNIGGETQSLNKHSSAIDFFHTKAETLRDIEEFQKIAINKNAKKSFEEAVLKGTERVDTKATIKKLNEDINNLEKKLSEHTQQARALSSKGIPEDQINRFLGETSKYQAHLNDLRKNIQEIESGKMGFRQAAKIIGGATPDKNFTTRTTFQNDLGGNLRKDLERSTLSTNSYDIGSLLNDPDLDAQNINLRARNLAPVLHRLRQDRIHYATKEVLTAFDEGGIAKIAENYVWKRIKNELPKKLEMISSGEVVGNYLKKKNYFGLKIENEGIPIDPDKLKRFERKYGYKVDVELDSRLKGIAGLEGKIKVSGLEVSPVSGFNPIFKGRYIDLQNNNLGVLGDKKLKLLNLNDRDFGIAEENRVLLAKLLNNDRSEETLDLLANKLFNKNLSELDQLDLGEMNGFLGKIQTAGGWIEQKTGGKIKTLAMQTGNVVLLDKALFGVEKVTLLNGNHLNVFSNKNAKLFLQNNLDKKTKEEQIQQLKRLLRLEDEKGYGGASINRIVKLTIGKDFLALSKEEQDNWFALANEFKSFSEWVKTQKNIFGDGVDDVDFRLKLFLRLREEKFGPKPVDVDSTNPAFLLFQSIFNKNALLDEGYKLTDTKFIGTLQKINKKMQELQKKWEKSKLGKMIKFVNNWRQIAAEKMAAFISKTLAKLLGVTAVATGILATLMPIIQALAEKVIKKGIDYAVTALKGILKLDFQDLEKMLNKDLKHITQGCLFGCAWITVIFIIPIVGIFGTLSSVTAPVDYTRNNYEGYGEISDAGEPNGMYGCSFCAGAGECIRAYGGWTEAPNPPDPGIGGFYYHQKDSRWANIPLSGGTTSTIGGYGCFVTSIAMVYKYFGDITKTPDVVAYEPGRIGPCSDEPSNIACVARVDVPGTTMDTTENGSDGWMIDFFANHPGGLIIVQLMIGAEGSSTQHFAVISGWNGSDFILYDPLRGPDACLRDEYPGTALGKAYGYYQEGYNVCIPNSGGEDDENTGCGCTDKVPNNDLCVSGIKSTSDIANKALEIACYLKRGVACYYNRPGEDMPKEYAYAGTSLLWRQDLVDQYSCEYHKDQHGYWDIYFWCTWLIRKAYGTNWSLGVASMCSGLPIHEESVENAQPGDVVCFRSKDNPSVAGHVGILYSKVEGGYITVIESNSWEIVNTYSPTMIENLVLYFARP